MSQPYRRLSGWSRKISGVMSTKQVRSGSRCVSGFCRFGLGWSMTSMLRASWFRSTSNPIPQEASARTFASSSNANPVPGAMVMASTFVAPSSACPPCAAFLAVCMTWRTRTRSSRCWASSCRYSGGVGRLTSKNRLSSCSDARACSQLLSPSMCGTSPQQGRHKRQALRGMEDAHQRGDDPEALILLHLQGAPFRLSLLRRGARRRIRDPVPVRLHTLAVVVQVPVSTGLVSPYRREMLTQLLLRERQVDLVKYIAHGLQPMAVLRYLRAISENWNGTA